MHRKKIIFIILNSKKITWTCTRVTKMHVLQGSTSLGYNYLALTHLFILCKLFCILYILFQLGRGLSHCNILVCKANVRKNFEPGWKWTRGWFFNNDFWDQRSWSVKNWPACGILILKPVGISMANRHKLMNWYLPKYFAGFSDLIRFTCFHVLTVGRKKGNTLMFIFVIITRIPSYMCSVFSFQPCL